MNIQIKETDDRYIISFEGDIDMVGIKDLKDTLFNISRSKEKDIVVDLQHADYLDSSGIGMFLTVNKMQKEKGQSLKLINIPDKISRILKLSSLDDVLL